MSKQRQITLEEDDWQWLVGWFKQLFKGVDWKDMSSDSLRMSGIIRTIEEATLANDSGDGEAGLGETRRGTPGKKNP